MTGTAGLLAALLRLGERLAPRRQDRLQLGIALCHAVGVGAQALQESLSEGELERELLLRELHVALGLALLARQAAQLRLHLGDQVLHPLQVLVRLLEPALGAVLPVAIEADAGRLLEQHRRSSGRSESSSSIIFASMTTPASLPSPVPRSRSWMSRSRTAPC